MSKHHWTRRDKRTAYRAGHVLIDKPMYPGELYGQRGSFGAFRPEYPMYDDYTPYEFVEFKRGRKVYQERK